MGLPTRLPSAARLVLTAAWAILSFHLLFPSLRLRPAPSSRRDFVFALYHPTYTPSSWSASPFFEVPALGHYATNSPSTASLHIAWAQQNKIDGYVLSYGGKNSLSDAHIQSGLLSAPNIDNIKFLLLYETLDRLVPRRASPAAGIDLSDARVFATFLEDVRHMKRLFWHRRYFEIGGRPVLLLRKSRIVVGVTRALLDEVRRNSGVDIYFVGDECYPLGKQDKPAHAKNGIVAGEQIFDAYASLGMHEDASVVTNETALQYHKRVALPLFQSWASEVPFFPLLTPKYNVYGLKTLSGTPEEFWLQVEATKEIKAMPVSDTIGSVYIIRSFNQWFEGSPIEPSLDFGFDFLNVIKTSF